MKKVMITGAGTGFGHEAALRLAEKGFDVIATVEIWAQVQTLKRQAAARGVTQSQYEVRVARDAGALASGQGLVWDSGTVNSAQSFDVPYGGPALASQTRYYWQVRVRDRKSVV